MSLRGEAASGFGRAAAAYERGRPAYPAEAVAWMAAELGITEGSTVIDLGAGTGKFTRMLGPRRAHIIAVEPVAAMRAELARRVPGIDIRDGTAEAIPCRDEQADVVVAAQAFHWFATVAAVNEISRVLRPGGGLGLIWNRRLMSDRLQASIEAVIQRYRGDAPAHERNDWRSVLPGSRFEEIGQFECRHAQAVDLDGLLDRVLSTSFIAALDDQARERVEREIRGLVAGRRQFVLPYRTEVYLFRRT